MMTQRFKEQITVAYVACGDERKIVVLQLFPGTGEVRVVQEVIVPGTEEPSETSMPLALHPAKHMLYAGVRASTFPVASFTIDPASGKLQFCALAHLSDNTVFMKVDRSGRFLAAASYSSSSLSLYRLDDQGGVPFPLITRWETPAKPHSILFEPSNRSFYVACLGGGAVLNYRFDADRGTVSPGPVYSIAIKDAAGPRHQALHPNGRFLFVLNELAASIAVVDLQPPRGLPAPIVQTFDLAPVVDGRAHAAADIHLTPCGHFLYASERDTSMLTGFTVNPHTGSLTCMGAWETEASPRSFALAPTGDLLLAAGQVSNHVSLYSIESGRGLLTRLARMATPGNPSWVEIIHLP